MKKINAKQLFNLVLMTTVLIMSASCKKKTPPEDEPKVDIWTQNEKSAIGDYLQN
jgi:hypothetical protein